MKPSLPLPALALLALALAPQPGRAQEVGAAGAVNPAARGTPPARPTRVLELGARVIHKERIQTTGGGSVQLIFLDKSTLNIGPNSDVVIDEFVYDPNRGAGKMAVSMTKGVLRFVGGNISYAGGATVKTPVATIGIRGGVATIKHNPCDPRFAQPAERTSPVGFECGTRAINHFGVMSVTSATATEVIRRPGFAVTVLPGGPPAAPQRVSQAEVDATNRQLSSKPGQKGGARSQPTDQTAARAGVGVQNAGVTPSLVSIQQQTAASAFSETAVLAGVQQRVQTLQQQATASATQAQIERQVLRESPGEPVRARAFALTTSPDPALNSPVPYVLGSAVATGDVRISPVLGYRNDPTPEQPDPSARTLQAAFGLSGSGASQRSTFMVSTGVFFRNAAGETVFDGGFGATSQTGSGGLPTVASGTIASTPGSVTLDGARLPSAATVNQNAIGPDGAPAPNSAQVLAPNGAVTPYSFQQSFTRAPTPSNLGANRPDGALTGWAGGLVTTRDPSGNTIAAAPLVGANGIVFDPGDSRVQMHMAVVALRDGTVPPGAYEEATYQFGSVARGEAAQSAYVDYGNFGARQSIDRGGGSPRPHTTVNGNPVTSDTLIMTTANTANVQSFFPGVTFCECEFTRWGLWSAQSEQAGFSDRVHLGSWVAGRVPDAVDIPTVGTATYRGHVIASMANNGNQYLAAGNLVNTINFANRTGSAAVTNLDGQNYAGLLTMPASSPYFFGSLTATDPRVTMQMTGNLYRGSASPVGEMGGNVLIQGSAANITGSGIFAARMTGP